MTCLPRRLQHLQMSWLAQTQRSESQRKRTDYAVRSGYDFDSFVLREECKSVREGALQDLPYSSPHSSSLGVTLSDYVVAHLSKQESIPTMSDGAYKPQAIGIEAEKAKPKNCAGASQLSAKHNNLCSTHTRETVKKSMLATTGKCECQSFAPPGRVSSSPIHIISLSELNPGNCKAVE